jgi:HlyD family secretion protein
VTRRVLLAILLLLIAVGGGIWWWSARRQPAIVWQDYAEADFVGPTQQGLLTAVFVTRGDEVAGGAPLFVQDDANEQAARDQAAHLLAQAERQLANLQQGGKPTEVRQAEVPTAAARRPRSGCCAGV